MFKRENIISLRCERQFLTKKANVSEYIELYRDMQPGQSEYWHGFGEPPILSFRADFDDKEFNRARQADRTLVKGRFQGGNIGWVERDEMGLFASVYRKKHVLSDLQDRLYKLILDQGPLTIHQIKEETSLLVKEIAPMLHKLQEAFLIYEDQFDGSWERGWYSFSEVFPNTDVDALDRRASIETLILRFAFRNVYFDAESIKSYYKLPVKDIKIALSSLISKGTLISVGSGYILKDDAEIIERDGRAIPHSVLAMHRNDFLVRSQEHILKSKFANREYETLQYLFIDGDFCGAAFGKFRYGPNDVNEAICDERYKSREDEIAQAIASANYTESICKLSFVPLEL